MEIKERGFCGLRTLPAKSLEGRQARVNFRNIQKHSFSLHPDYVLHQELHLTIRGVPSVPNTGSRTWKLCVVVSGELLKRQDIPPGHWGRYVERELNSWCTHTVPVINLLPLGCKSSLHCAGPGAEVQSPETFLRQRAMLRLVSRGRQRDMAGGTRALRFAYSLQEAMLGGDIR